MKIINLEGQYCNMNYIGCSTSSLVTAGLVVFMYFGSI